MPPLPAIVPPPQIPLKLSALNPSELTGRAAPVCLALAAQITLLGEGVRVSEQYLFWDTRLGSVPGCVGFWSGVGFSRSRLPKHQHCLFGSHSTCYKPALTCAASTCTLSVW